MESPYHGEHEIRGPVRVKPDASLVILQTGGIYSGSSLSHVGSLPNVITDALWINNTLYTLRKNGSQSQIQVWNASYTQTQVLGLAGEPLRLLNTTQGILAITLVNATPRFTLLNNSLQLSFVSASPKHTFLPGLSNQTLGLLKPGLYSYNNQCSVISIPNSQYYYAQVTMCVQSIGVREDGTMSVNLSWTLTYKGNEVNSITKDSDANNPNMNLVDNSGRRYNHTQATGAAAQDITFFSINQTASGSFIFPPAKSDATVFTFNDNDQDAHICGLLLPLR